MGSNDGSIQIWDHRRSFVNTAQVTREGHARGSELSSIKYSYRGHQILTRGLDDRMILYDARAIKKPVNVFNGLINMYSMTDAIFSPNDGLLLTGTSLEKGALNCDQFCMNRSYNLCIALITYHSFVGGTAAELKVFNATSFKEAESHTEPASVIRLAWHPKINQVLFTRSDGATKVFYDERSRNGALLCVGKVKVRHILGQ